MKGGSLEWHDFGAVGISHIFGDILDGDVKPLVLSPTPP